MRSERSDYARQPETRDDDGGGGLKLKAKTVRALAALARSREQVAKATRRPLIEVPAVDPFIAQHGAYERNGRHVVNRGGTAVDRWRAAGQLSDTQIAAILHMQRLWGLAWSEPRVVANLDRTVFGSPGDGDMRSVDARIDIRRIEKGFPRNFWDVFENVCRHDEPAGIAGSRVANDSRSATTAARLVVCMVADMIAMRERLSA